MNHAKHPGRDRKTLFQRAGSRIAGDSSEAFKIPEWDRNIRLIVHEPHRFARPPGRGDSDLFTQVSIDCFAGRSLDAKRALYQCIVRNLEALGIPKEQVTIMLREIPKENWGIQGGQAACDVDVGFVVEV
jgi:phenylpyruvate tautomerase PptA (4-oxalocrotonate tautomerase family)